MSTTIRRGGPSARKAAASQGTARKVRVAKDAAGGALDTAMGWLPLTERQLHGVFLALFLAIAAALAWAMASAMGVPDLAAARIAQVASDAGFEVRHVEVRGVRHMNELKIYERVLGQRDRAMTQVDLAAVRASLMAIDWVADARVSRQLPDTLVVDIVERVPSGVLAMPGGRLMLVDASGHQLEPIAPAAVGRMLVVSGPGAAQRIGELGHLLDTAPALRPQVRGAEWIGNRRWNLTFRTDQVLALPEGDGSSVKALIAFARLDTTNRLLGGRVAAFDMRAADRVYLRVPGRAQEALADARAAKLAAAHAAASPQDPSNQESQ